MDERDIFMSNKKSAKKFCKWMYEKVIPQYLETGTYTPSSPSEVEKYMRIFDKFYRNNPTENYNLYLQAMN